MPLTLIIVIILVVLIVMLAIGFVKTSTELRRLFQISTSPIISTVSEMINGLTSIRVFGKVQFMSENFDKRVQLNNSVYLHEAYVAVWMSVWLDLSMAVLIAFVSFFVVLTRYVNINSTDNDNVYGFVLSTTLSIGGILPMMLFTLSESLKSISSVQRLHEYYSNDEIERPFETPEAPKKWPSQGKIEVDNLTIRYREGLPLVLKGVNLSVGKF